MLKKLKAYISNLNKLRKVKGLGSLIRISPSLRNTVSLVVPVHNVELYIEDFLRSVVTQSTRLKNLEVILVDDGSTDRSGDIAKRWAARYPGCIRYIRQENGGVSAARNAGLDVAAGEWVSFPDPDDILPPNWLRALDKELMESHDKSPLIVSFPLKFFFEKTGSVKKTHPLMPLFKVREVVDTEHMGRHVILAANTSFFRRSAIEKYGLRFDTRVKPAFEDGHFVNRLILRNPNMGLIRLPKPYYVYRKRAAQTSLLDTASRDSRSYTHQLIHGYLDLIKEATTLYGACPQFIQRTVLYDMSWKISNIVIKPHLINFLSEDQKLTFKKCLVDIFSAIDVDVIREMEIGQTGAHFKAGVIGLLKNTHHVQGGVEILKLHADNNEVQIRIISSANFDFDANLKFYINGSEAPLLRRKVIVSEFLGEPFSHEHHIWLSVSKDDILSVYNNSSSVSIKYRDNLINSPEGVRMSSVAAAFLPTPKDESKLPSEARRIRTVCQSKASFEKYSGCWVLMDRDIAADDNAEHLYRYLMKNGTGEKCYFILRKGSPHWNRLQHDGFNLIDFGSDEHIAAIANCKLLISSHADHYVRLPAPINWIDDLLSYKFVFLQHGVINYDMSRWINGIPIDLLITSARAEFDNIVSASSNYHLTDREVVLTGMPRHDALLNRYDDQNEILIMPTWRNSLVGKMTGQGMKRLEADDFASSSYLRAWNNLLGDETLKRLCEKYGKKITFQMHPNMAMYERHFITGDHIDIRAPYGDKSIQDAFTSARLVITDYSSIAFECAYLGKPIIYYQFDREEFFTGAHLGKKGYFDHRVNGFGPVTIDHEQTLQAIEEALSGNEDPIYEIRRNEFFAFRDGKCCERVYKAIVSM